MLELRSQAPDDDPDEPEGPTEPSAFYTKNLLINTGGPGLLGRFRIKEGTAATFSYIGVSTSPSARGAHYILR